MDRQKTGALISAVRKEKGMTQRELAERIHVSDRTISKWERGAGFPDVALWESLADALELPVQCLVSGQRLEEADGSGSDHAVRAALRAACLQGREKMRKNIRAAIGYLLVAVIAGVVGFGILDGSGALQKEVSFRVTAGIYRDGQETGETTVTVEGALQRIGKRDFQGTFAIGCVPQTGEEGVSGWIRWDVPQPGYQTLTFYRVGLAAVPTEVKQELYISPDLREFALELEDGTILATNDCLAALQSLSSYRYALDSETEQLP